MGTDQEGMWYGDWGCGWTSIDTITDVIVVANDTTTRNTATDITNAITISAMALLLPPPAPRM